MSLSLNPPSLLLARTPALPSTSTSSGALSSSRGDYAHPPHASGSSGPHLLRSSRLASRESPIPNLNPLFTQSNALPGTVEVRVEATTFLVHKEVLVHASPFFEVLLCGEWAETTNLSPISSSGDEREGSGSEGEDTEPELRVPPTSDGLLEPNKRHSTADSFFTTRSSSPTPSPSSETPGESSHPVLPPRKSSRRPTSSLRRRYRRSVATTQSDPDAGGSASTGFVFPSFGGGKGKDIDTATVASSFVDEEMGLEVEKNPEPAVSPGGGLGKAPVKRLDARIHLKEEGAPAFQDLLLFIYPQSECVCTWNNAPELMTMSRKFDMPLLKRHVLHFLLSSAAGKPIQAMRIAEDHQLGELYREASRFLLDNWTNWDSKELETLSAETLLKLEKKRSWFLERLLKLGLVNSSRDYCCPASCPDPEKCARSVDEKWRSAWAACFRFGAPQPSAIYRALRCLEPSLHSPALLLPHTACQHHAQRWFADLVDRMFGLLGIAHPPPGSGGGLLGWGGGGYGSSVYGGGNIEAQRKAKYFLCVDMVERGEGQGRERKQTIVALNQGTASPAVPTGSGPALASSAG